MVFHEQPSDPWKRGDFKLLEAYEIKQKETCGHCGNPIWLCHSEGGETEVYWEVQTSTCYADKTLKEWHKDNPDATDSPYAVPFVYDYSGDFPVNDYKNLPTRKQFFEERADD